MTTDYRASHLAEKKGEAYHEMFLKNPYRNMLWQFEQGILDRIAAEFFAGASIRHLDFACGTGRILSHLESRAASSTGVDLSPTMLEVARRNSPRAEIIEADITRADALGDRAFNLITAFRFFPNAQPALRSEVMAALARHLDDGGYLVFNNHRNTGSARNRLARLFGRRDYQGMSIAEARALLAESGLKVARIYHLAVFPAAEGRTLLPISLLRPLEALLSKCRPLRSLGEDLIFVCKRG